MSYKVFLLVDSAQSGLGACAIPVASLQMGLWTAAKEQGITVLFDTEANIIQDSHGYSVVYSKNGIECVISKCLIVVCEGSCRNITKNFATPIIESKKQFYLVGFLNKSIGKTYFTWRRKDGMKYTVMGNTVTQSGPLVLIQLSYSRSSWPRPDQYHEYLRSCLNDLKKRFKFEIQPDCVDVNPEIPITFFPVQESRLDRHQVENVVFLGDCARTGHWMTGIGAALGLFLLRKA